MNWRKNSEKIKMLTESEVAEIASKFTDSTKELLKERISEIPVIFVPYISE
ncbi:MAG: hypothetical protein IJW20_01570 [Clostridia bacterium]|nr:hypothetical protein [Clostridia bacterium]